MKKSLIMLAVAFCASVSMVKIYNLYKSYQPVAGVGECVEINDPQSGRVELKVIANKEGITEGVMSFEIMPLVKIYVPIKISYVELREIGATKIECSK